MLDPDELDECFREEVRALEIQLEKGNITEQYFDQQVAQLRIDLAAQKYNWAMKNAGR